jgi:hypothetical protein
VRFRICPLGISALLVVAAAACATPPPTSFPPATTDPAATPSPADSTSQSPGASGATSLVCDPNVSTWTTTDATGSHVPVILTLTCENGIAAAEGVLPPDSAAVAQAEFFHGDYCPPLLARCALAEPDWGYVVLTMTDGATLWATVSGRDGVVSATYEGAFPPA